MNFYDSTNGNLIMRCGGACLGEEDRPAFLRAFRKVCTACPPPEWLACLGNRNLDPEAQMNNPIIGRALPTKPFIVVEARTKAQLEAIVEAAWLEGYRPSGEIAIDREPLSRALYFIQGMVLKDGPST